MPFKIGDRVRTAFQCPVWLRYREHGTVVCVRPWLLIAPSTKVLGVRFDNGYFGIFLPRELEHAPTFYRAVAPEAAVEKEAGCR